MTTFNGLQRPDNIAVGLNISYTVPVGKIARVTATLSADNTGSITSVSTSLNVQNPIVTASANSEMVQIILSEGDVLTSVRTTGSGSTAQTGTSYTARVASCTTVMTVDGANSCMVSAAAIAGHFNNNTGLGASQNTTTGVANFGFYAEEYFG